MNEDYHEDEYISITFWVHIFGTVKLLGAGTKKVCHWLERNPVPADLTKNAGRAEIVTEEFSL